MKAKNQQEPQTQTQNKGQVFISARVLEMYIDLTVRGLVSFTVFGLGGYLILVGYFGMAYTYVLPIIFLGSILSSPLLSKIKLGHKVQNKYDNFLRRVIVIMNNYGKKRN